MKRIILLLLLIIGGLSFSFAQDSTSYTYNLKPDVNENQEIVLQSKNAIDELKLTAGVMWMQKENQLQLTFDRKTSDEADAYLLLFPLANKKLSIKGIADSKSGKNNLWSKSSDLGDLSYFLESDNLEITDYKDCYKSLANNNEEEFIFKIKNPEDFTIKLTGIYVAKTLKRPWYYFSSRDKKVEYKANPITLTINFPQKGKIVNLCKNSEPVLAYIEAQKKALKADHDDFTDAQKNQNCTLSGLIQDAIRRKFVETNDKCEKYVAGCDEIAQAIKGYNDECESIMNQQCVAPPPSSGCNMSEQELTAINSRLKNLQMKINLEKKENANTDSEAKEYQSLKTTVNGKLTPECRRKYKSLIDAFTNYCTNIESLF